LFVGAVAASAVLVLLVRARHDPGINQGNPSTWPALEAVMARRQYDVPGLWPRTAPLWLQLANWFEYADWQSALSLGPTPVPTIARTGVTIVFALLGVIGSAAHRAADRRRWRAVLLLFLLGSVGVALYLNMRASPSFGWGILPADAIREARERDYFFVLSFWAWGLWSGYGAVTIAQRVRVRPVFGVIVAGLPIILDWSAVSRRHQPEAGLPRELGEALLGSSPQQAVLFVDGDNDTYPLWFLQQVDSLRRDVTVVTVPLLGADWYAAELRRRYSLLPSGAPGPTTDLAQIIAQIARQQRRPVAAAVSLDWRTRDKLGTSWILTGLVYVEGTSAGADSTGFPGRRHASFSVDSVTTREWAFRVQRFEAGRSVRPSTDTMDDYAIALLSCPRLSLLPAATSAQTDSLASLCNHR
jgi:hypothetical protein